MHMEIRRFHKFIHSMKADASIIMSEALCMITKTVLRDRL